MRNFELVHMVALVTGIVLTTSVAIGAASKPKLSFVKSLATIQWSTEGGSSPGGDTSNANSQSLRISVTVTTSPTVTAGASAFTFGTNETLVNIRGRKLSEIDHLGFDSKGTLTGGAPRISLGTVGDDGDHTYFLAAFHCNNGEDANGWRTSDFINDTTDCVVFRSGTVAPLTWAAAVVLADANNEVVASTPSDWFLVVDEGPFVTYIDRLSVQAWCWTGNGTGGIINQNSGDCI